MERDRTDWRAEFKRFGAQLLYILAMWFLFVFVYAFIDAQADSRDGIDEWVKIYAACGAALVAIGGLGQAFVRGARDQYGEHEGRLLEANSGRAIAAGGIIVAAAAFAGI